LRLASVRISKFFIIIFLNWWLKYSFFFLNLLFYEGIFIIYSVCFLVFFFFSFSEQIVSEHYNFSFLFFFVACQLIILYLIFFYKKKPCIYCSSYTRRQIPYFSRNFFIKHHGALWGEVKRGGSPFLLSIWQQKWQSEYSMKAWKTECLFFLSGIEPKSEFYLGSISFILFFFFEIEKININKNREKNIVYNWYFFCVLCVLTQKKRDISFFLTNDDIYFFKWVSFKKKNI